MGVPERGPRPGQEGRRGFLYATSDSSSLLLLPAAAAVGLKSRSCARESGWCRSSLPAWRDLGRRGHAPRCNSNQNSRLYRECRVTTKMKVDLCFLRFNFREVARGASREELRVLCRLFNGVGRGTAGDFLDTAIPDRVWRPPPVDVGSRAPRMGRLRSVTDDKVCAAWETVTNPGEGDSRHLRTKSWGASASAVAQGLGVSTSTAMRHRPPNVMPCSPNFCSFCQVFAWRSHGDCGRGSLLARGQGLSRRQTSF